MALDYSKFDKMVDLEGLQKDIKEAAENGGNYKEVPHGKYEVEVNKMELGESKKGDPMVKIWFKILSGEFKNSLLFFNQVVTSGFQFHIVNQLVNSMESGIELNFESYTQYAETLMDIHEAINGKLEFELDYGENKGFNTFKITDIFDVE